MWSTLGSILQVGPAEFADRPDVVPPHRPTSLKLGQGAHRSLTLLLPPASALMMSLSPTPPVILGVCFFAGFCPGHMDSICTKTPFCCSSISWNSSFLLQMQEILAKAQEFSWIREQQASPSSSHPHCIASGVPPLDSQIRRPDVSFLQTLLHALIASW